ncbi:hypothetical protein ONZ45_g10522 [Pleurotus djamor]|nr:hypothetical protein ONZ45_g10522 [Pleurotus djamor]
MLSRQSRQSKVPFKARESIFAGNPDIYRGDIHSSCPAALAECVMALEDCCEEAYEAQKIVFLLVDERTVHRYKADLIDEVEPAINELIERAEQGYKALKKRESALEAKLEAAQTRSTRPAPGNVTSHKLETRRYQMLKKQTEKLEREAKELEDEIRALESSPKKRRR